jgi:hypothetical protein
MAGKTVAGVSKVFAAGDEIGVRLLIGRGARRYRQGQRQQAGCDDADPHPVRLLVPRCLSIMIVGHVTPCASASLNVAVATETVPAG